VSTGNPERAAESPCERRASDIDGFRLVAARAECELLVLVTSRFTERRAPNWYAALNLLVAPAFFRPWYNVNYIYDVQAVLLDTRTGVWHGIIRHTDSAAVHYVKFDALTRLANTERGGLMRNAATHIKQRLARHIRGSGRPGGRGSTVRSVRDGRDGR